MKDTEAWAISKGGRALIHTVSMGESTARQFLGPDSFARNDLKLEPVVIVSQARYDALTTCERICKRINAEAVATFGEDADVREVDSPTPCRS